MDMDWTDGTPFELRFKGEEEYCCTMKVRLTDTLGSIKQRWFARFLEDTDYHYNGGSSDQAVQNVVIQHIGRSFDFNFDGSSLKELGFNHRHRILPVDVSWTDDTPFALSFKDNKQQCCTIEKVRLTDTLGSIKQRWLDRITNQKNGKLGQSMQNIEMHHHSQSLDHSFDSSTLKQLGFDHRNRTLPVNVVLPIGALFENLSSDWSPMRSICPSCEQSPTGFWYHPGGSKCYFVAKQPDDGHLVQCKRDQSGNVLVRCCGCKSEYNYKEWQFKCPDHGYQATK
jgi:hypothetical protein